jgi:hypothetical protein
VGCQGGIGGRVGVVICPCTTSGESGRGMLKREGSEGLLSYRHISYKQGSRGVKESGRGVWV